MLQHYKQHAIQTFKKKVKQKLTMVSPNSSSVFFLHFGGKEGREGAWLDKGKLREIKGFKCCGETSTLVGVGVEWLLKCIM